MRRLTAALAIAAGLASVPTAANPTIKFSIVRNIGGGEPDRHASQALRAALNDFLENVRSKMAHPELAPPVFFEFPQPSPSLTEENLPPNLPPGVIAVVVGDMTSDGHGAYVLQSEVYIGPSPVRAAVQHPNLFTVVRGNISPAFASRNEVQLHELLIGYALLRWAWLENRALVDPIARTIFDLSKTVEHAGLSVSSSTCLGFLRRAAVWIGHHPPPDAHGHDPGIRPEAC